ncbi:O-antigen ligase family protein [Vibrio salinus]|uniref:O-antigen ligase family protein n=1 Tax=Vibrio salinus TaxID=2899784 RepID=UPI001E4A0B10|nr:O-antigen ligase family protein [Vibrio salinus]MCE0493295.1 O-antigen ligase family protein [Vibrio salinus]
MSKSELFCFYLLLGLIFWLPIPLASHRIWAWSIVEVIVATQTIILFSFNFKHLDLSRLIKFTWLLLPLSIFQLWVFIQIIPIPIDLLHWVSPYSAQFYHDYHRLYGTISLDSYATQTGLLKGLTYTLFAMNSVLLINSLKRVRLILYVIVASGTFQAFYGAIMVLLRIDHSLIFGIPEGNRVTGSFVYYNHLANYLMMCLCLGTGLIISQMHQSKSGSWRVRLERWFDAVLSPKMLVRLCLIIMVIALVMTRSRMGNTAFFSVTLIGGGIAMLFYKNRPRALTVLVISIILIDTVIVGSLFGLEKVKERLEATSATTETRDQVVEWSMDILKEAPFTGTGLGAFYSTFPSYSHYNIGYYNYAHNDYIQFSTEVGIPATIFLGVVIIFALFKSFNALRTRHSKTLKGTAIGCLMAIIGELIHISVDFNLQAMANVMTFILVLVLAGISCQLKVSNKDFFSNR